MRVSILLIFAVGASSFLTNCKPRIAGQGSDTQAIGTWMSPHNTADSGMIVFLGPDGKVYSRANLKTEKEVEGTYESINEIEASDIEANGIPKRLIKFDTMVSDLPAFYEGFFKRLIFYFETLAYAEKVDIERGDKDATGNVRLFLGYAKRVREIYQAETGKPANWKVEFSFKTYGSAIQNTKHLNAVFNKDVGTDNVLDSADPEFFAALKNFRRNIQNTQAVITLMPKTGVQFDPRQAFTIALSQTIFEVGVPYPVSDKINKTSTGLYLYLDSVGNDKNSPVDAYLDISGHINLANGKSVQVSKKNESLGNISAGSGKSYKRLIAIHTEPNFNCNARSSIAMKIDNGWLGLPGTTVMHQSQLKWDGLKRDFTTNSGPEQSWEDLKVNLIYFCIGKKLISHSQNLVGIAGTSGTFTLSTWMN